MFCETAATLADGGSEHIGGYALGDVWLYAAAFCYKVSAKRFTITYIQRSFMPVLSNNIVQPLIEEEQPPSYSFESRVHPYFQQEC